jgi:FkbH-like protein
MKYIDLIAKNKILGSQLDSKKFEIHIISNIIVNELNNILEYSLRTNNINAICVKTDYDNIIQNAETYKESSCIIIFWELANIIEDIIYIQNSISDQEVKTLEEKILNQIDYLLKCLDKSRLVIFNKFSFNQFNSSFYFNSKIEKICSNLNDYLISKKNKNFFLIDLNKIFNIKGLDKCINYRDYSSIKTLYTFDFYRDYVEHITPLILVNNGKAKKVIIFDCDNTLWPGIIGEDGAIEIKKNLKSSTGKFFYQIHNIILDLYKKGVILCICSKNNEKEVCDFMDNNADLLINSNNFLLKKINWNNKHDNILEISKELNLSLDSFVFVDDSEFEINLINNKIPQIKTLLVPSQIYDYPRKLLNFIPYFHTTKLTDEDKSRNKSYQNQFQRESFRKKFSNIEEYLKSLDITIDTYIDKVSIVSRMSQITQKTNQFNLTTKRYTELEIEEFIKDPKFSLIAISVSDNFVNSGITGLCIIEYLDNNTAKLDTIALSCRILGRKIEEVFLDIIINFLNKKNIQFVHSCCVRTSKNEQVLNYFDNNSFELIKTSENKKDYKLKLNDYHYNNIDYIKINYEKE